VGSKSSVAHVVDRLRRGDRIYMQLGDAGERQWWFESPLEYIDNDVVSAARQHVDLMELGDSLFGLRMNSQTWQAVQGSA
jgi:hypothetical protein